MDLDQFALASFSEDHKEDVAAHLGQRKRRFRGARPGCGTSRRRSCRLTAPR
jgi:hypothetical protein